MSLDAIERWERLLQTQPGNELARFSLAKALYDAGRWSEAQDHFEAALAAKPDWMVVQILLGKCLLARGDRVAARAALTRARELAIAQEHEGPQLEVEELLAELG